MSTLVDPTLCPDCRAHLDASASCPSCGLVLRGPLAAQLWQLMVQADGVIDRLRSEWAGDVAAGTPGSDRVSALQPPTGHPGAPASGASKRRRLPAASVPVVLLSLGALCLLVAAVVFVAVTWSLLGITGRTLVLLGLTALLAVAAVVLTRRGLRGASETFWLVVAGMLVVDVLGARSAGLLGLDALGWRGTAAVLGATLLVFGIAVASWGRRQPTARLYGAESVALFGATVTTVSNGWMATDPAVGTVIAIPALVALAVLLRRSLSVAAYGFGGLAAFSWVVLLAVGWSRNGASSTAEWWLGLEVWPLLAAAALAAPGVRLAIPSAWRSVAAGAALLALAIAASGPPEIGSDTRDSAVASAVLVVLGVLAASRWRHWAEGAAVLAALGAAGGALVLVLGPWEVLSLLEPEGATSTRLRLIAPGDPAAWTYGLLGLAVATATVLLLRQVPSRHVALAARCVGAIAPAAVALGGLGLVLHLGPSLGVATLAAAVAASVAGAAAWWVRDDAVSGWVGAGATAYLVLVTVWASAANDLLLAVTLSVVAVTLAVVYALRETAGSALSAAICAVLAVLSGAAALAAWGVEAGADVDERAVVLALFAALAGLVANPGSRRGSSRAAFEVSALLLGAAATATTVDLAASAMTLTIVGSAICLLGVVHRDREGLGWVGAVVLGGATLVRVLADVRAPELYTLPAAVLLVAVGAWRLAEDRDANSFLVLGSGLTLGLLPSLLLTLDEPVSVRGALVGAAGVLVLAVGVARRLASPFVLGALTTAVLALRHLEPYADAVPRWVSLGGVGLALLAVGVTWEARRRNLESAGRYFAELR